MSDSLSAARTTIPGVAGGVGTAPIPDACQHLFTREAVEFLSALHREFDPVRKRLLQARRVRQASIDAGEEPEFPSATKHIREDQWKVAPPAPGLLDRRVEITGPVDRKMIINALNSGANVFMADFEDANAPTWLNNLTGQVNLQDANRGTISYASPEGKTYQLGDKPATLVVRPRGWHLPERHFLVGGEPISGSLFDFGLYFFHNARLRLQKGQGAYFYLPKLQSHLEARLWNDVFLMAEDRLDVPRGTIRATVLIEHILAAFEAEEILYELREHSAGLNCGRWDYIFSIIKTFRNWPEFVLPDRSQVTMTRHCMRSYTQHVIAVCHRRGAHAMGGMAAQIPIKNDSAANEAALAKVREDKLREVTDGHDGTWVAHPGLVPVAREIFDRQMPAAHQMERMPDTEVTAADLLEVPDGTITEGGLRSNINVGLGYLEAWLGGNGCVPLYHLMEDAATCEISRTQIWQWIHHAASLEDGRKITAELFHSMLGEELKKWKEAVGEQRYAASNFQKAAALFSEISAAAELPDFLTLPAYEMLNDGGST